MNKVLSLICLAMLLSSCSDSKLPKTPPKVPEPKLMPSSHSGTTMLWRS
jgi:PBP1b-binding outer membrane lipoprotein LpoB